MATEQEQDPEPAPPPDAMSWERRVSRPPVLNDQTAALPIWARPFAKPEIEHMVASRPKLIVMTKVAVPYVFAVALVANAVHGVPMRHMLFTVPATTIIGFALLLAVGAVIGLTGWLSGYRPARVSWLRSEERSSDVLASALQAAAVRHGFIVVWAKGDTFVATRNVEQAARGLVSRGADNGPRRLSLLAREAKGARSLTLKIETHGPCLWDTGEAEELQALARGIVQDASVREPWIAQAASWQADS